MSIVAETINDCGWFSKYKGWKKIADHQPYDLKITLDRNCTALWSNLLLVPGGTCSTHKFI